MNLPERVGPFKLEGFDTTLYSYDFGEGSEKIFKSLSYDSILMPRIAASGPADKPSVLRLILKDAIEKKRPKILYVAYFTEPRQPLDIQIASAFFSEEDIYKFYAYFIAYNVHEA